MASPDLGGLPVELTCHIINDFVHSIRDLKRLSLTSKSLRWAAAPKLFHDVAIDLDTCILPELNEVSHPLRFELKHVKSMHFKPHKPKDPERAFRTMRQVVLHVPQNALRELWLPVGLTSDKSFASSLFRTSVFRRQQQLSALGFGLIPSAAVAGDLKLTTSPSCWADSISTLHVPCLFGNFDEVRGYATIIKHASRLRDLRIGFYVGYSYRLVGYSAFAELFQELARCGQVLKLDRLMLVEVGLGHTQDLIRWIDFSSLLSLELVDCGTPDELLEALTSSFVLGSCRLKSFRLRGGEMGHQAIQSFLRSFSGLQSLHLGCEVHLPYARVPDVFDINSLETHYTSLTQLYLFIKGEINDYNAEGGDDLPQSQASLETIGANFQRLTSVALFLPDVDCGDDEDRTPQWTTFCTALRMIVQSKSLRSLRLVNWPRIRKGQIWDYNTLQTMPERFREDTERLHRICYLERLDSFANSVLNYIYTLRGYSSLDSLPVLSFGDLWGRGHIADSSGEWFTQDTPPVTYLPSRSYSRVGNEIIGKRIDDRATKDLFPQRDPLAFNPYHESTKWVTLESLPYPSWGTLEAGQYSASSFDMSQELD